MICIGKYEFSKEDYEMYKSFFENRLDKVKIVSIDSVSQKHDKTFKEILSNKQEMTKFLEQFIGMEVEEPRRILEYCMEIMREIQKNKKEEINPLIIPIVIYTGRNRWKVPTDFSDTQKVEEKYKKYRIKLQYQLIDISEYNKKELIEKDTKISNMMLLEKCKTREEVSECLIELSMKAKDKERVEWIKDLVEYVFPEILGEEIEKILKIIEEKEKSNMRDLVERIKKYEEDRDKRLIRKGRKEGICEGRSEGIKESITNMIINMLKFNESEETIMKYTNAKKEDIEKIKKELKIQPN